VSNIKYLGLKLQNEIAEIGKSCLTMHNAASSSFTTDKYGHSCKPDRDIFIVKRGE
jgi:hypothetical protein